MKKIYLIIVLLALGVLAFVLFRSEPVVETTPTYEIEVPEDNDFTNSVQDEYTCPSGDCKG